MMTFLMATSSTPIPLQTWLTICSSLLVHRPNSDSGHPYLTLIMLLKNFHILLPIHTQHMTIS